MATIEIGELIPLDVYHHLNESLELKCLLDAHLEKLKEVNRTIVIFDYIFAAVYLFVFAVFKLVSVENDVIRKKSIRPSEIHLFSGEKQMRNHLISHDYRFHFCNFLLHPYLVRCCFFSLSICRFQGDSSVYCLTDFDTILCWPKTLRGTMAYLPCLAEYNGIHYDVTSKSIEN